VADSIKQKALRLLARREYTRVELRAKLLRPDTPRRAARLSTPDPAQDAPAPADAAALALQVDTALDELQARGLLSDSRAVQSLVRQHAGRYGPARLAQTLKARGAQAADRDAALQHARQAEWADAQALWQRRFGQDARPTDRALALKALAKQQRFLLARGFSGAVVARLLRSNGHESPLAVDGGTD
jgi:regulatory protein